MKLQMFMFTYQVYFVHYKHTQKLYLNQRTVLLTVKSTNLLGITLLLTQLAHRGFEKIPSFQPHSSHVSKEREKPMSAHTHGKLTWNSQGYNEITRRESIIPD